MILETNILEWDKTMNLNVRATFHLISLAIPFLKYSPNPSSITVLSGAAGVTPVAGSILFSTSMAMVNMIVKNTALEVGHLGIRVNAAAPGVTNTAAREKKDTNFFNMVPESLRQQDRPDRIREEVHRMNERYLNQAQSHVPLVSGQEIEPKDVA
jgi:NAD(P)-dependent dehydrogenase (short-subunit alcohol dehydrogenase family)